MKIQHREKRCPFRVNWPLKGHCWTCFWLCMSCYLETQESAIISPAVMLQRGEWDSKCGLPHQPVLKCLVHPLPSSLLQSFPSWRGWPSLSCVCTDVLMLLLPFQVKNALLGAHWVEQKMEHRFQTGAQALKCLSLCVRNVVGNRWCVWRQAGNPNPGRCQALCCVCFFGC